MSEDSMVASPAEPVATSGWPGVGMITMLCSPGRRMTAASANPALPSTAVSIRIRMRVDFMNGFAALDVLPSSQPGICRLLTNSAASFASCFFPSHDRLVMQLCFAPYPLWRFATAWPPHSPRTTMRVLRMLTQILP